MAATISPCGQYRYYLSRDGDPSKNRVAFVMLNPSTADADIDDATIRRCRTFARGAGFVVVNLYAFRATKPEDMYAAADPVGPDNWKWWEFVANQGYKIICAWGGGAKDDQHVKQVISFLRHPSDGGYNALYCLGLTKYGKHPRHPLYVKSEAPIVPWVPL